MQYACTFPCPGDNVMSVKASLSDSYTSKPAVRSSSSRQRGNKDLSLLTRDGSRGFARALQRVRVLAALHVVCPPFRRNDARSRQTWKNVNRIRAQAHNLSAVSWARK